MSKIFKALCVALIGLLPSLALCQSGYVIFFANGIDNNAGEADLSRSLLERQYGHTAPDGSPITYQPAYASSASAACDLYEVYLQRKQPSDNISEFRKFLAGLATAIISPELSLAVAAFRAGCFMDVRAQLGSTNYTDDDLTRQIADVRSVLTDGSQRKVVIVAHSQGNLYANLLFRSVAVDGAVAIVGVASPTNEVVDHRGPDTYETSWSDVVINALRAVSPDTLQGTFHFPGEPADKSLFLLFNHDLTGDRLGHNFAKVYINPDPNPDLISWGRVKSQIDKALESLSAGPSDGQIDFDYSPTPTETAYISQSFNVGFNVNTGTYTWDGTEIAQAFDVGRSGYLTHIDVKVLTGPEVPANGNVLVSFYAVPGPGFDTPSITAIATVSVPFSTLPTNTWQYAKPNGFMDVPWTSIALPSGGLPVVPGQHYLVGFRSDVTDVLRQPGLAGGVGPTGPYLTRFERLPPTGTWRIVGYGYFLRTRVQ